MDPAPPARATFGCQLHRGRNVMQIVRIGLDLAKYVFEIHAASTRTCKTVVRRRPASPVTPYQCSSPTCHLALLAWRLRTAHTFGAKALSDLGRPRCPTDQSAVRHALCEESNKNDRNDAEAILRGGRPTEHALRAGQVRRTAGGAGGSSDSQIAWSRIAVRLVQSSPRSSPRSTASSLQRTSAISGGLSQGSLATMRTGFSIPWFAR